VERVLIADKNAIMLFTIDPKFNDKKNAFAGKNLFLS
jgi:hypothetical protein